MAHETQTKYSNLVLDKLRATSVFYGLMNHSYEGTPTAGAVKIPVRDGEVSVRSGYSKTDGATFTNSSTAYATLVVDKDMYVNELIDGYDAAAVPDNLVADRIDSAGYSQGIKIDTELIHTIINLATGSVTTSKTDAYGLLVAYITKAKKTHVKKSEMWIVVSPDFMENMLNDSKFVQATQKGDATVENGSVTRVSGVEVFESDNLPDTVDFILGNRIFAHFVDDWKVPVAVKELADGHIGASALQGRNVYGRGISRPATFFVKKADTYAAPEGLVVTNGITMPSA